MIWRVLTSYSVAIAVVLAALVTLPTPCESLDRDEYLQFATLEGRRIGPMTPSHLWTFFVPAEQARNVYDGLDRWWRVHDDARMRFFRPLSSWIFGGVHAVVGRSMVFHHLHVIAWSLVLAAVTAQLYRKTLSPGTAALAALIAVVNISRSEIVGGFCAVHILIAAVFAFGGLLAHLRWREDAWRPGRALALVGFALGFTAGETTLQVLAYVFAYELVGSPQPLRVRARALAPVALLVVVYLVGYKLRGYGSDASGFTEPSAFPWDSHTREFLVRNLSVLATDGLTGISTYLFVDRTWALVLTAVALALVTGVALRRALRALPEREVLAVRWLLLGAVLALLPSPFALPGARLLTVPSLGLVAAIAVILAHAATELRAWSRARGSLRPLTVVTGLGLAVLHLVVAPVLMVKGQVAGDADRGQMARAALAPLAALGRADDVDEVVVFATSDSVDPQWLYAAPTGASAPRWWVLSEGVEQVQLTRTGPSTVELQLAPGPSDSAPDSRALCRRCRAPVGTTVEMRLGQVRVLDANGPRPRRIEVRFARSMESPSLRFVALRGAAIQRVPLPALGETIELLRASPAGGGQAPTAQRL